LITFETYQAKYFSGGAYVDDTVIHETKTSELLKYDVVHPRRVDSSGRFISHQVQYLSVEKTSHRHRRDASANKADDFIYFAVDCGSREVTLNVTENKKLLHTDFVVERLRDVDGESADAAGTRADAALPPPHRSSLRKGTEWPCHFRGKVVGQADSAVAISTCNGLVSTFSFAHLIRYCQSVSRNFESCLRENSLSKDIVMIDCVSRTLPNYGKWRLRYLQVVP